MLEIYKYISKRLGWKLKITKSTKNTKYATIKEWVEIYEPIKQ